MTRVVVIGAGPAGLVAACRLAGAGVQVSLLSKGLGGLQLSQGTIDVLGYDPERVDDPLAAATRVDERHPYAAIGVDALASALAYVQDLAPGLLVGSPTANVLLPTALGALRPTCLAQPSMLAATPSDGARWLVVGLRRLKDFPAELVAANLARTRLPDGGRLQVRATVLDVPARQEEIDSTGLTYARAFDEPSFRERFARALSGVVRDGETVLLPAVLGLRDSDAWAHLSRLVGHPVAEVPLPPPSVPGMRLNEALTAAARAAGVRLLPGVRTGSPTIVGRRVEAVRLAAAPAGRTVAADAFVLATGGFESGGLELDSYGRVRETTFGLPLAGLDEGPLVHGDFWGAEQPLFRVGVRVGTDLRPLGPDGAPVYDNLYAVGGLLAGASRWAEKSGDGIAIGSAVAAADWIGKELA